MSVIDKLDVKLLSWFEEAVGKNFDSIYSHIATGTGPVSRSVSKATPAFIVSGLCSVPVCHSARLKGFFLPERTAHKLPISSRWRAQIVDSTLRLEGQSPLSSLTSVQNRPRTSNPAHGS